MLLREVSLNLQDSYSHPTVKRDPLSLARVPVFLYFP